MKKILLILFSFLFFFITAGEARAQIFTTEKLITVDIGKQRLYAWENGQVLMNTAVSTGMYYTPTVKGSFSIYKKIPLQDMRGYFPPYEPYYIKNVPSVMYFYGAYAIHGTHWHSKFGWRASHGCVNVPVTQAQWLYSWADQGTRVEIF